MNCIRKETTCEWPGSSGEFRRALPRPASLETDSTSAGSCHLNSALPITPGEARPPAFTLEDMQLLHHWTTRAYLFHDPVADDDARIWGNGVVDVAFRHPFLLHGILAFSALHKAIVDLDGSRANLLTQADAHMSLSLDKYLGLLEKPAPETVVPCFILSSICFAYNLATAQIEEPESPIDAILHCFRLLRGVGVVIGEHWERLKTDHITRQLLAPTQQIDRLPLPTDTECSSILNLKYFAGQLDSPARELCIEAIEALHITLVKTTICSTETQEHSTIMTWQVILKPHQKSLFAKQTGSRSALLNVEFLKLCYTGNIVGSIIILYWAVLCLRVRSAWWLKGWVKRLIHACEELLAPTPELKFWLDWPIAMSKDYPIHMGLPALDPPNSRF
jgi:hypothetical protein